MCFYFLISTSFFGSAMLVSLLCPSPPLIVCFSLWKDVAFGPYVFVFLFLWLILSLTCLWCSHVTSWKSVTPWKEFIMKEESGAPPTLNRGFCLRVIFIFVHGIMSWIGLLSFLALSFWLLCSHPSLLLSSFIWWCISWSFGSSKQVYQHKPHTYHHVSPILDHRDPKQCADSPI